jgi:hypothetical protein
MDKIEIVKNVMRALEQCKFDQVENYLTDDFTFVGPVPNPINKREWLDLHKKMSKGIPDLKFNMKNLSESGNVVNGSVQLSGTHSKEMPSLLTGIEAIPATNKKIQLPEENITAVFKGEKINSFTVEKVPNGGVAALLKQIGAKVPTLK